MGAKVSNLAIIIQIKNGMHWRVVARERFFMNLLHLLGFMMIAWRRCGEDDVLTLRRWLVRWSVVGRLRPTVRE